MSSDIDVVVIGSGMGGATFTCGRRARAFSFWSAANI
jgi:hypothetical protein